MKFQIKKFLVFLLVLSACSKTDNNSGNNKVELGIPKISSITRTSFYCISEIKINSQVVLKKGFLLSKSPNVSSANFIKKVEINTTLLEDTIKGLAYNSTYYIKAYAITKDDTTYSQEQIVNTISNASFSLNQNYGGGFVFFVDSTGDHGLIVAPRDIGRFQWQTINHFIGGTKITIGSGKVNTGIICEFVKIYLGPTYNFFPEARAIVAAQACDSATINGYSDWYLPSWDELKQFADYTKTVNVSYGLGMDFYWTSTESSAENALFLPGANASSGGYYSQNKSGYWSVRPMRSF